MLSDESLNDFIKLRSDNHNLYAKNNINKIGKNNNLSTIYHFETDIELVINVIGQKKKKKGWNCPFGHITIPILFADYFSLGYLALGGVLESKFLKNGHHFKNIISTTISESDTITAAKILNTINLKIFYPVGGLSEILTNKIVKNSILANICSSCVSGNNIECLKCIKCFRKLGFVGKLMDLDNNPSTKNLKKELNYYPVKMSTSTIYSCKLSGYSESKIINALKDIDISFIERYYPNYLYPNNNEIDLVPQLYKKVIENNLKKYNIEPMTKSDINKLINIHNYFDNKIYIKSKLK